MALVANTSTLEDDEPYHDLGLPVARLFVSGSSLDTVARATVRTLATKFEGRVAFMERNATAKSYDWRQHGLPGRFPSFAVAASMEHNATRYAFLEPSYGQEEFWSTAVDTLSTFLEEAIAGQLGPSFSSQEPPDDNLTLPIGAIRTLVGRRCRVLSDASDSEVLVEAMDEWRRDHQDRSLRLEHLAVILARWNITVYRIDLGHNECPPNSIPHVSAGYSGYFFVHKQAKLRGIKVQRLKKNDPSFDRIIKFVAKHSEATFDVNVTIAELDASVHRVLMWRYVETTFSEHAWSVFLGAVGIVVFGVWRCRGQRRKATSVSNLGVRPDE